ncbi:hypothetical protein [Nocardia brasiliensis]|uniref:hypothetical protein n=1 Tax=Nocardia brasiliensis TaxID=37326 RepID=UPI002456B752|nr:hypothetical protein [Nocardia brasiliensis]
MVVGQVVRFGTTAVLSAALFDRRFARKFGPGNLPDDLARYLGRAGRRPEGLDTIREAIAIDDRFSGEDPGSYDDERNKLAMFAKD